MFKNYWITSLRNFRKNLIYLGINVASLAVAMAICVIGFFNYHYNATYNTQFENASELYKIHGKRIGNSSVSPTQANIAPLMQTAGFEAMRYHQEHLKIKKTLSNEQGLFHERTAFIDPAFLKHFKFSTQQGNPAQFNTENAVILTEQLAIKLFGHTDIVGELIYLLKPNQKEASFQIGAVLQKMPHNISFHFDLLLPIDHYFDFFNIDEEDPYTRVSGTFLNLPNGQLDKAAHELSTLLDRQGELSDGIAISSYQIDNILDWPAFESTLFEWSFPGHLHPASVMGIISSSIAILLLACFNFVNTSMAISGKRLKEIGLRKVLGGNRQQIITQFMVENSIMILLGLMLSVLLLTILIPIYNSLYQFEMIQVEFISVTQFVLLGIGLLIVVSILAGAYPAFYLSGLSSLHIFRNKSFLSGRNLLGKVLLNFQFVLCFYNLFSLLVFLENSYYQQELDRGYLVKNIINIPLNSPDQLRILQQSIDQIPAIDGTAGTQNLVGFSVGNQSIRYEGNDYYNDFLKVGPKYLQTLGVSLQKGNWLKEGNQDTNNEIIVNDLFERQIGHDLLNKSLIIDGKVMKIKAVVENFNTNSIMLKNKIKPLIISLAKENEIQYLTVQADANEIVSINNQIENIWYKLYPNQLYEGFYQSKVMEPLELTNRITISINFFIAIISLLISTLGLYTLISLVALRRMKEIGIRKVLGATRWAILHLLGKEFYWILGLSAVIGLAMANYMVNMIMDIIFAYHISTSITHFIYPVIAILMIVGLSIGYKMFLTSKANPNEQLRME